MNNRSKHSRLVRNDYVWMSVQYGPNNTRTRPIRTYEKAKPLKPTEIHIVLRVHKKKHPQPKIAEADVVLCQLSYPPVYWWAGQDSNLRPLL